MTEFDHTYFIFPYFITATATISITTLDKHKVHRIRRTIVLYRNVGRIYQSERLRQDRRRKILDQFL